MFCFHLSRQLIWPPCLKKGKVSWPLIFILKGGKGAGQVIPAAAEIGMKQYRKLLCAAFTGRRKTKESALQTFYFICILQPSQVWSSTLRFTTQQDLHDYNSCFIYSSYTLGRFLGNHLEQSQVLVVCTGEWAVQVGFRTVPVTPFPAHYQMNPLRKGSFQKVEVEQNV